jgi:hypothetical protein
LRLVGAEAEVRSLGGTLKGVPLIRTAAAERGFVDAVIQPRDTRKKLI